MTPVSTPPGQKAKVEALLHLLEGGAAANTRRRKTPACLLLGSSGEQVQIPDSVFYALERVVEVLARGDSVMVVPVGKELTTQQAADLLNISRQYLVRLLDEGTLPHTKIGRHRRLKIEDVLSYKEKRGKERRAGLRKLSELTQEFGGYDPEDE
jgi:excisionase family DNA binding protein